MTRRARLMSPFKGRTGSLGENSPGSPEVLVTGGNNRAGLAVARSLTGQGVSFLVVGEEPHSLTFHSRYVKNALLSPSPIEQPEDYFEFILTVVKKHKIQLGALRS